MATSGPFFPGTAASLANAPESANAWVNPGNIVSDNATEATITAATFDSPDISELLVASNFGFAIPAGATIDGITVEIDRRSIILNSGKDNRVQLATGTTFASLVGTNKASATVWPTTSTIATYGGAADTWTAGLTAAQVNAVGFAVFLSSHANIANADIGVDFIRVTVDYTAAVTSGTGAVSVPVVTVAGTGALVLTGTGAVTVPAVTVAGTGAEVLTATGAVSIGAPTVAGTGSEVFTATGAISVPPATVAGVGAHPYTATGALTVPSATTAGTGELVLTATGAIVGQAPTVAGTGAEILTATGAVTVGAPTVAGSGAEVFTATGVVTVPAPIVSGVGELIFTATGAIGVPAVLAVGSGALVLTGSGSIAVPVATIVGVGDHSAGVQPVTGTGAITAPAATVAGSGAEVHTGTGAITVPAGTVAGVALLVVVTYPDVPILRPLHPMANVELATSSRATAIAYHARASAAPEIT